MQHCPGSSGREPLSWVSPWMEAKGFTFFDLLQAAVSQAGARALPFCACPCCKDPSLVTPLCLNLSHEIDLLKTPEPKEENIYLLYPKQTLHKRFSSLTILHKACIFS